MRNMSFALTTKQFVARTKTVTRRTGWAFLKPGDRVCGIEKGQGLKKGEKVSRLGVIEIISNRPEPVRAIITHPVRESGIPETTLEGFPEMTAIVFADFLCEHNGIEKTHVINRIEFKYVDDPTTTLCV